MIKQANRLLQSVAFICIHSTKPDLRKPCSKPGHQVARLRQTGITRRPNTQQTMPRFLRSENQNQTSEAMLKARPQGSAPAADGVHPSPKHAANHAAILAVKKIKCL